MFDRSGFARLFIPALCWLAALSWPALAAANDAVWDALRRGGQVALVRHGLTTPGVGDPDGFRLEDCATQRNLIEIGRDEARALGAAFRARNIAIARVLSSPWCRCLETARIAFGGADISLPLSNLFGRPENRDAQVQALRALVGERRSGGNLVLVSHGSTILALTGVSLGTAEMVVVTPGGEGQFAVVGRVKVR